MTICAQHLHFWRMCDISKIEVFQYVIQNHRKRKNIANGRRAHRLVNEALNVVLKIFFHIKASICSSVYKFVTHLSDEALYQISTYSDVKVQRRFVKELKFCQLLIMGKIKKIHKISKFVKTVNKLQTHTCYEALWS